MKFYYLLCFVILFVVINCDKIKYKGEENEIIGNFENFALSVNSKTNSLIKPVVPHNEFNVSFKPLLNIFNEKDEQSNNHNSGLSSKKSSLRGRAKLLSGGYSSSVSSIRN